MNSRLEELVWIEGVLMDLRYKYKDHNESILDQLIEVVSFRREGETKTEMERWKQDDIADN